MALLSCTGHGAQAASIAIPTWAALHEYAAAVGIAPLYSPVFLRAAQAIRVVIGTQRDACSSPEDGEQTFLLCKDAFFLFRQFASPPHAVASFADGIINEVHTASSGAEIGTIAHDFKDQLLALAAVLGPMSELVLENLKTSNAAQLLQMLVSVVAKCMAAINSGHRGVLAGFLACMSEAMPLLQLPHRHPEQLGGCENQSLLTRVSAVAVLSLGIPEVQDEVVPFQCPRRGVHLGAACLLAAAEGCGDILGQCARAELGGAHDKFCAMLGGSDDNFSRISILALAQALSSVAASDSALALGLMSGCFDAVAANAASGRSTDIALAALEQMVSRCGTPQRQALSSFLEPRWKAMSSLPLNAAVLAPVLSSIAAASAEHTVALAQCLAQHAERCPRSLVALFEPATAIFLLLVREKHTAVAGEFAVGLSRIASAACSGQGRVAQPLSEAWARFTLEACSQAPSIFDQSGSEALRLALVEALVGASIAAEASEPPVAVLALIAGVDKASPAPLEVLCGVLTAPLRPPAAACEPSALPALRGLIGALCRAPIAADPHLPLPGAAASAAAAGMLRALGAEDFAKLVAEVGGASGIEVSKSEIAGARRCGKKMELLLRRLGGPSIEFCCTPERPRKLANDVSAEKAPQGNAAHVNLFGNGIPELPKW